MNEKKRNDMVRLIENLLINVHSVNPSVRPRMNTPSSTNIGPKPPVIKPPIKPGGPPAIPHTLSPADEEDDDQEEYLPMQPVSPEIEPEDYEAPSEVVMPDGTTLGSAQTDQEALADELYEELPEDGAHGNNDGDEEPEDYEDPSVASNSATSLTCNAVPLPPKAFTRMSPESPGYQATGKPAEDTDGLSRPEVWQYAKTMKDKRISTSDLKTATCKGILEKLGGRGHNTWQKRFCILDGPLMYFFKDEKSKNFNNLIQAGSYNVSEAPDKAKEKKHQFAFKLTCRESGKDYYFRTTTADLRAKWMSALLNAQSAPLPPNSPLTTGFPSDTQLSMHTLQRPSVSSTAPTPSPVGDEPEQESYEEVVAPDSRIPTEDESDEERFEQKSHQPQLRAVAPPIVPMIPQSTSETFDAELYDEHPQPEEEEEYLACETQMQHDIIESAASPIEIIVDTDEVYEAPNNGVDLEKVYMSLYNFTAEEDDEMTLQRGDLVFVPDNATNSDWWLAELVTPDIVKTSKKGFCPANFLTLAFEQL